MTALMLCRHEGGIPANHRREGSHYYPGVQDRASWLVVYRLPSPRKTPLLLTSQKLCLDNMCILKVSKLSLSPDISSDAADQFLILQIMLYYKSITQEAFCLTRGVLYEIAEQNDRVTS